MGEKVLRVSLASALLLWALELAYSLATGAWLHGTAGDSALFLLLSLLLFTGGGVAAAAAQIVLLIAARGIRRRLERRWGSRAAGALTAAFITIALSPYLLHVTRLLFSGKGVAQYAHIAALRIAFASAAVGAVYALAFAVIRVAPAWFSAGRRGARRLTLACTPVLLVVLYSLNARWFVGQYLFAHQALSLCLFLIAEVLMLTLLGQLAGPATRRTRWLRLALLAACVEVAALSLGTGSIPVGSRQLSAIHRQLHLGRQLVRIYGFGDVSAAGSAAAYAGYRETRDSFVWSSPSLRRDGFNLLWVVVDAVRPDRLSMYGAAREVAPRMAQFSMDAFVFSHAYAQGYNTETTLAPMLTGCYTSTIARSGGIGAFETIPELLRRRGYRSRALMQGGDIERLGEKGKPGAAFDEIETGPKGVFSAPEITRRAIEILKERDADRPFFLFAFYDEPHAPYVRHEGFDRGNTMADLYDGEISYADRSIGELLDYVRDAGLDRDTIVLITADHGEELGDHGGYAHGVRLYDSSIHVPLLMRVPGLRPGVVTTPVQAIDIVPTLAQMLDLDMEKRPDGSSFHPYLTGRTPPFTPRVFSEAEFGPTQKVCVIEYPRKLVYHRSDSYFELFDLDADPREGRNRIGEDDGAAFGLKAMLLSWLSYRDRSAGPRETAGDPAVAAVVDRLRRHDEGALRGLEELSRRRIDGTDFALLARALSPYQSRRAAEFYIAAATNDEALRPAAVDALRLMVEAASAVMVESDLEGNLAEMKGILETVGAPPAARLVGLLLASPREGERRDGVFLAGAGRIGAAGDELFALYRRGGGGNSGPVFAALCALGDPRVEDDLLAAAARTERDRLRGIVPLLVNYRSERCRDRLIAMVRDNADWQGYPRLADRMSMEIGKSGNRYMLPVLMEIFSRGGSRGGAPADPHLAFAKRSALMQYAALKGRENLDAEDRRAMAKAYADDPQLEQFKDVRELCEASRAAAAREGMGVP